MVSQRIAVVFDDLCLSSDDGEARMNCHHVIQCFSAALSGQLLQMCGAKLTPVLLPFREARYVHSPV